MPAQKRHKTAYPGVYYIEGKEIGSQKTERIYYIMYRKNGKQIHEKAGRQSKGDRTPARANNLRAEKIKGRELSNKERRAAEKAQKEAEKAFEEADADKWTLNRLWAEYKKINRV